MGMDIFDLTPTQDAIVTTRIIAFWNIINRESRPKPSFATGILSGGVDPILIQFMAINGSPSIGSLEMDNLWPHMQESNLTMERWRQFQPSSSEFPIPDAKHVWCIYTYKTG